MDASLETLVTTAYVFACSLSIPRSGPKGKATDQELIALAVAQAATGLVSDRQFLGTVAQAATGLVSDRQFLGTVAQAATGLVSDRQFLGTVGRLLPGCFPELPGQSQFNRRLRRLTPQIAAVQLAVAGLVATGSERLVDGTLLSCANYAGCAAREDHLARTLPGLAQRIVQRLLALTLGIFCNTLLGRPARALAAYDGR